MKSHRCSGEHIAGQRRSNLLFVMGACRPQLRGGGHGSQRSLHLGSEQGQGHSALPRARRQPGLLCRVEPEGFETHCVVRRRRLLVRLEKMNMFSSKGKRVIGVVLFFAVS